MAERMYVGGEVVKEKKTAEPFVVRLSSLAMQVVIQGGTKLRHIGLTMACKALHVLMWWDV